MKNKLILILSINLLTFSCASFNKDSSMQKESIYIKVKNEKNNNKKKYKLKKEQKEEDRINCCKNLNNIYCLALSLFCI